MATSKLKTSHPSLFMAATLRELLDFQWVRMNSYFLYEFIVCAMSLMMVNSAR
jgi:hypothetical protein